MKLNKKGFMMAEVVVVSSIILIFLAGLFTSYNQIYTVYKTRLNYYDTNVLFKLGYYRDILIENNKLNNILSDVNNNNIRNLNTDLGDKHEVNDNVFMVAINVNKIDKTLFDDVVGINQTFKDDYVRYLSTAVNFNSNYVMIMERCNNDKTNCKYGYIEIYDGYEEST